MSRPVTTCQGTLGHGGSAPTYRLVSEPGDADRAGALARQLTAAGFTAAAKDPDYLVEATYGDRPGRVGAYAAVETEWLQEPVRRPWWRLRPPAVEQMTVRFIDARTGTETYRASASRRHVESRAGREPGLAFATLAQAALSDTACRPAT